MADPRELDRHKDPNKTEKPPPSPPGGPGTPYPPGTPLPGPDKK